MVDDTPIKLKRLIRFGILHNVLKLLTLATSWQTSSKARGLKRSWAPHRKTKDITGINARIKKCTRSYYSKVKASGNRAQKSVP